MSGSFSRTTTDIVARALEGHLRTTGSDQQDWFHAREVAEEVLVALDDEGLFDCREDD